jgi:uncharacterized membrane protein
MESGAPIFAINLFLVILIVVLWLKVRELSQRLRDFEWQLNLLRQQLSNIELKLNVPGVESKPGREAAPGKPAVVEPAPAKPAAAEPAAVEKQPAVETITPPPPRVSPEPVPIPITAPGSTEPATPRIPPAPIISGPSWEFPKFDWENIVGVKLFSWIAGVALLLAAVFFLRYSISKGWLMPPVRMAIGVLVGLGLLVLCELKAARKYPVTANAMDASAIAILFSTFFAAHALWDLIGGFLAFVLMVLVTAIAVLLSIRRDSAFIAVLGLVGGFATPALLSTGENSPVSLFTYILLLNAGLAWVATRKKWPLLTTLSLVFTVFYQWGWVMKFLTAPQLPMALGIFLVFPILALVASSFGQKEESGKSWISLYGQTANISAVLPLLFVLYTATVPGYGHRYVLLFSFLFLLDVGLFAIAAARGQEIMHVAGGLSTILIFAIWLRSSYESHAWPLVLGFIVLFSFFYLAAPYIARRFGRGFSDSGKRAVYAAPLLLFVFPCLAAMEPACAAPGLLLGTLFLVMLGASAYAIRAEEGAVYFIAALAALLSEAVWSWKYLTPERLWPGLALYAIFGLLYIGVPIAGRRWHKSLRPEAAGAGLLLLNLALLFFLAAGAAAPAAIWGLALLLLILNAGLLWEGAACKLPELAIAGMMLSWIILGTLWASVPLAAILVPALVVVAAFALFVLAANVWLWQKTGDIGPLEYGIFLGLIGHVFLLAVAVQKSLSVPPWQFLGTLLVLDLATGIAALYTRRSVIHQAAMAASAVLLMIWIVAAGIAPWPAVGILAAAALSIFSIAWIYLAKRGGIAPAPFFRTAAVTVLLAQIVAIVAAGQSGSPGVGFLLAAHVFFLAAILCLEWIRGAYVFAVLAVLPAAVAISLWFVQHLGPEFWPQQLMFAVPVYLVFIAYPLLLGHRSRQSLAPYLGAVMAGIPFFFQARYAILQAGWGQAIGVLPVVQAVLMALLVMRLLKIEPPGARSLGRLALVAGAGLAFITVAIPLQFEKEWITIGWALEGAALAWLYGRIPYKGLLYAVSGLFAAVFVRLALNPAVLNYQPRAGIRIWNWYLYTYLVSSAALILGGWLLSKTKNSLFPAWPRLSKLLPAGGTILPFLLLNIEIADFYSTGSTITFNFTAALAQDLTYTLGWALFAVALLAIGIAINSQPARIASLALLAVTILKCFIHDLARLGGLYLVASLFGLAICLALVALALQKFVLSARKERK